MAVTSLLTTVAPLLAAGPLSPAVALLPLAGVLLLLAVALRAVGVSLPAAASRLAVVEPLPASVSPLPVAGLPPLVSESPLAVVSPSVAGLPLWVATASLSAAVMHSGWRWHPFVGAIFAILAGTRGESVVFVSRPLSVHLAKPKQPFFVLGLISLESSHLRFLPRPLKSFPRVQPRSPRPCPGSPRSLSHAGVPVPLPAGAQCSPLSADAGRWAAPLVVPPLGLPRFRPTGSHWSISGGDPLRPLRSVEGLRPLLFCWLLTSGNPSSPSPSLSLSVCSP